VIPWRALVRSSVLAGLIASATGGPALANDIAKDGGVTAYLDGKAIPISEISRYYCDDFSYPVIQCSRLAVVTDLKATIVLLVTSADYVTIYDGATYSGAYMHVSQDYGTLMTIGWNDKISSFKGRNSQTGTFWTNWFYGGSSWSFCCNVLQPTLGGYNNTFSALHRS
jgi:hypothetical protein